MPSALRGPAVPEQSGRRAGYPGRRRQLRRVVLDLRARGCAGDEGHCEPAAERRAFDFRPEHQLTPVSKRVMITGKLQALVQPGQDFTVTIVPYVRPELAEPLPANLVTGILQLDRVQLLTYQ